MKMVSIIVIIIIIIVIIIAIIIISSFISLNLENSKYTHYISHSRTIFQEISSLRIVLTLSYCVNTNKN